MVDAVATTGRPSVILTELGIMWGAGGAPRGLRTHQKPLRNQDRERTPTDAPTGEPPPSQPIRDLQHRIDRGRPAKAEEGASSHSRARPPPKGPQSSTQSPTAKILKGCRRISGSLERGGDRRSSKGAADPTAIEVKGCHRRRSIWKTPGGSAPDEQRSRTKIVDKTQTTSRAGRNSQLARERVC